MYSLAGYGSLVADRVRVAAYAQALQTAVHDGSIVVDIGTGPGIFAVLACRLGAKRVYAIEPSHVIQVAREVAAANNYADRIEFIQEISTRVTLPERADVIVSDLRGVLPFFHKSIPDLIDARHRFLNIGGELIPRRDVLWVAIVEAPDLYHRFVDCWKDNLLKQDLSAARRHAVNDPQRAWKESSQLLTEPQSWVELDYMTVESPDASGHFCGKAQRPGLGHGLLIWFDTTLTENIGFSNGPGAPESIYGALFFPWSEPVELNLGQSVVVDLQAKLIGDDYLWCWNTKIHSVDDAEKVCTHFEQSQLLGLPLSLSRLHKAGSRYVPQVSEEGRLHLRVFELIDGQRSLEAIARQLAGEFPQRFTRWQDALSYAGQIAQEYSL
jgi:protein arginine N-methyltransferase 1